MARYFGWTFRARFAQIMEGDKKFSCLGGPFGRGGGGGEGERVLSSIGYTDMCHP